MNIIAEAKIKEFGEYLSDNEKSKLTVEKYLRDVGKFMLYANSAEIDKQLVLSYKNKIETEYAAASANSMLASVNSFRFRTVYPLPVSYHCFNVSCITYSRPAGLSYSCDSVAFNSSEWWWQLLPSPLEAFFCNTVS